MHRIFLLLCLLISGVAMAQEALVPPGNNPVIQQYRKTHTTPQLRNAAQSVLIDIPFIDDFSYKGVYPDPVLWLDNYVYINTTLARNPVTIGVATFDGLDANGNAYVDNNPIAQSSCDTLTSNPVFLLTKPGSMGGGQYSPADSIRLSFFYQKKGWGDTPDNTDSLVLELFNPSTAVWKRAWFVKGGLSAGQDTIFIPVTVAINDTAYFKDGFQFRFRNYGSQTGALDQWHLDYVRLYNAKNPFSGVVDTNLYDVAMTEPAISMLEGYTSLPWNAWKSLSTTDQDNLTKNDGVMYYNNLGSVQDIGFNHRLYDFTGAKVGSYGADNGNIFSAIAPGEYAYPYPVDTLLPLVPEWKPDSNFYTVKNFFSNGNVFSGLKSNDTVEYRQEFYNYYSYDDGTAEAGYDLVSSPNGKLAQQFNLIIPDTLRAVRMHFVQQTQSVSNKLFTLKIWSSLSPEVVIYQETNQRPVYTDEFNGYATYVLDQLLPVSGTIYIGFQQVLGDGLHLGFDRNTSSNSKMFYNTGGGWTGVTVANGSFMIRPVMGDSALFTGVKEISSNGFEIFPNPASSVMHIRYTSGFFPERMVVISADGRRVFEGVATETMDVSSFRPGVYFLRLYSENEQPVVRRFVVRN